MPSSLRALQQALELTLEMEAIGQQQDWERVGEMDDERMELLKSCFAEPLLEADRLEVKRLMEEILQRNERLIAAAAQERDRVSEAADLLHKHRDASAAYDACQHLTKD